MTRWTGGASASLWPESLDSPWYYDDDDDIYIMMKCLSVCLFVTKNEHLLVSMVFQGSFMVFHGF